MNVKITRLLKLLNDPDAMVAYRPPGPAPTISLGKKVESRQNREAAAAIVNSEAHEFLATPVTILIPPDVLDAASAESLESAVRVAMKQGRETALLGIDPPAGVRVLSAMEWNEHLDSIILARGR